MTGSYMVQCVTCGAKKAKKEAEINAENFQYVDKDRSNIKAKQFLLGLSKKETINLKIKTDMRRMEGNSLYLFSIENPVRRALFRVTESKVFEYFIILMITLSAVQLALDNPLHDPNSSYA